MTDSLRIETNGKHKVPWVAVVSVLWGLLIGIIVWTAQRYEARIGELEKSANSISLTTRLREEDRKLLDEIRSEQKEMGKLLARVADRVGVQEKP